MWLYFLGGWVMHQIAIDQIALSSTQRTKYISASSCYSNHARIIYP